MSNERLGIVEQRAADRERYGRFAYRPPFGPIRTHFINVDCRQPEKRTITLLSVPKPAKVKPVKSIIIPTASFRSNHRRLFDFNIEPRVRDILEVCAEVFDVGAGELLSEFRTKRLTRPRFTAISLIRRIMELSHPTIGRIFKRDHTSCLHGCRRSAGLRATDQLYRQRYRTAVKLLRQRWGRRPND